MDGRLLQAGGNECGKWVSSNSDEHIIVLSVFNLTCDRGLEGIVTFVSVN